MYLFPENVNSKGFFRFPTDLIKSGLWAELPQATKSIYPVIGIHADRNGRAFPSQKTIGILAGIRCEKTIRRGIEGLKDISGFSCAKKPTRRGRWAYSYRIPPPPPRRGEMFPFYRAYCEGGNWSLLSQSAHAVYPTLKTYAYFDYQNNGEAEESWADFNSNPSLLGYVQREFDIADPELDLIAEQAGVSQNSARKAFLELEDYGFIEREGEETYKIFRLPKHSYKTENLNSKMPY